jgi:hypothetical protein
MSDNNKKTYKVQHLNIKEITVGDRFVTKAGDIIEFIRINISFDEQQFEYTFYSLYYKHYINYTSKLSYYQINESMHDIKCRHITLKDKINSL